MKIDRALAAQRTTTRPAGRRLAVGFVLTAAVAIALVTVPIRKAEASLGSILGALESSAHVRIVRYAVDREGRRTPYETTDLAGTNSHTSNVHGTLDRYEIGSQSLAYDPILKTFVASSRRSPSTMGMKVRFVPGKGVYGGMNTEVERVQIDGAEIVRATMTGKGANGRYVIDASPTTFRPIAARHEVQEGQGWRADEATTFDYRTAVRITLPATTQVPRLTATAADVRYRAALSERTIAQVPLDNGRLVVRRVDVASDGTVFVAFQGGEARGEGFNGYTFRLTDSLGTEYARIGQAASRSFMGAPSPDGPFQMETFVPIALSESWRPRTLRLQAHRYANLAWAGTLDRVQFDASGTPHSWPGILTQRGEDLDPTPVDLPGLAFAKPTCDAAPDWAAVFAPEAFSDGFLTSMAKVDARAHRALDEHRWTDAQNLFEEELAHKEAMPSLGYGPTSTIDLRAARDQARGARRP